MATGVVGNETSFICWTFVLKPNVATGHCSVLLWQCAGASWQPYELPQHRRSHPLPVRCMRCCFAVVVVCACVVLLCCRVVVVVGVVAIGVSSTSTVLRTSDETMLISSTFAFEPHVAISVFSIPFLFAAAHCAGASLKKKKRTSFHSTVGSRSTMSNVLLAQELQRLHC